MNKAILSIIEERYNNQEKIINVNESEFKLFKKYISSYKDEFGNTIEPSSINLCYNGKLITIRKTYYK